MASSAAVASASKKIVAAQEDASAAETPAPLAAPVAELARAGEPALARATPAPTQAPAPPAAEAPAPAAPSLSQTSAPIKDIALQLNPSGQRWTCAWCSRARRFTSRCTAPMPAWPVDCAGPAELQSRLEENGYRSEMWRPTAASAPVAAAPASQSSTNQPRSGDGQPHAGGSQPDTGRRNQNQSNQPRWVEELESSLTGETQSSGGFYGYVS